ncbi:hypothetical protein OOZ63_21690 [Paucibacter sp. PLA-PC-4]|uniref:hypothetical protein n=1 Tax=Paucibacter sp. PLA-PC-4 TaxID=2993655 RepID=UPI00224B43A6|nr:hypothetical protein [Paucibacter sp. PLA-PC-4]MCX2864446.1 hypothetical protein [Paucibacter sp. PLA-PC-4]
MNTQACTPGCVGLPQGPAAASPPGRWRRSLALLARLFGAGAAPERIADLDPHILDDIGCRDLARWHRDSLGAPARCPTAFW